MLTRFFVVLLAAFSLPAAAQRPPPPCAPHDMLVDLLAKRYQESVIGTGIGKDALVELLVSPTGTWTMIVTRPEGLSCLVAAGEAWEVIRAPGQESQALCL